MDGNAQFGQKLIILTFGLLDTVKLFQKTTETENMAILSQSTSIPTNWSPTEGFILNTKPSVTQTVSE